MNFDTDRTDRLDKVLLELGEASSRTKAQSLIKQSAVMVNGQYITKPSTIVRYDDTIQVLKDTCPWVSQGGLKLDFAIQHFKVPIKNKIALDIGASTGGFSQVLLHHNIQKIFAIDVGTNQLHAKVRQDNRVVAMEQTDARTLSPALVPRVDIIVTDVSFISLTKVLPVPLSRVISGGQGIFLIKPQFEVGRTYIGKRGIVTNQTAIKNCITTIQTFFAKNKWIVQGTTPYPTRDTNSNQEYILYAVKS